MNPDKPSSAASGPEPSPIGKPLPAPQSRSFDTDVPAALNDDTNPDGGLSLGGQLLWQPPKQIAHFVLGKRLGQGGMGLVYQAYDSLLDRQVAIKVLPNSGRQDEEHHKRFWREARLAGRLNHSNVVTIYQIGVENGLLFIAMELVEGGSLEEHVRCHGSMSWQEATRTIREAATALAAAHDLGLVHRDIKPANLLRTSGGVTKVADFGLARAALNDTNLTQQGVRMGTPNYMAPEQWIGGEADGRSDLYSLICTYFFLLTARVPFEATSIPALGYQHRYEPFPDPRELVRELPDTVCRVLARGSAKEPAHRYQTAAELAGDLEGLLSQSITEPTTAQVPPVISFTPPVAVLTPVRAASVQEPAAFTPQIQTLVLNPANRGFKPMAHGIVASRTSVSRKIKSIYGWLKNDALPSTKAWLRTPPGVIAAIVIPLTTLVLCGFLYTATDSGEVKIDIASSVTELNAEIDGQTSSITGSRNPIRLSRGTHELVITSPHFETYRSKFSVKRGEQKLLKIALKPALYYVELSPADASLAGEGLTVNGVGARRTFWVTKPDGSPATIQASRIGYEPVTRVLPITDGGRDFTLRLKPQVAKCEIRVEPPTAVVTVTGMHGVLRSTDDGKEVILEEPNGIKIVTISAELPGYQTQQQEWTPGPGEVRDLAFQLAPLPAVLNITVDPPNAVVTLEGPTAAITGTGQSRQVTFDKPDGSQTITIIATAADHRPVQTVWTPMPGLSYDSTFRLEMLPSGYANRGREKLLAGDLENAISDLTEAIRLDPNTASHYEDRAKAHSEKGDPTKAIADYTTAMGLEPIANDQYLAFGTKLLDDKNYSKAVAYLSEAIRLNPSSWEAYDARGIAYNFIKLYDLANADLSKSIQLDPKEASSYMKRGVVLRNKGELEKAVSDITEAIRLLSGYARAYEERGITYGLIGNQDKAISDLTEALRLDPQSANAYYERGVSHRLKNDFDKSISDLTEALRINPQSANAYYERGVSHRFKQDFDKSISDLTEAIRLKPKFEFAYKQRGITNRFKGDADQALLDFTEAISLNPKSASAFAERGALFRRKDDHEKAFTDLTEAIRLDPKDPFAYTERGGSYADIGDDVKAIKDLTEAIRINPKHADAYYVRGAIYRRRGDFSNAISDYSQVILLDPKTESGFVGRGRTYLRMREYDQAITDFTTAIGLADESPDGVRFRAVAYARKGDVKSASADYKEALARLEKQIEVKPKDISTLNALAWFLATTTEDKVRNGRRAAEAARRACELTEYKEWQVIDTLAAACAECGEFEEAQKWQQKAVDLAGTDTSQKVREELVSRMELYRTKKPLREDPE